MDYSSVGDSASTSVHNSGICSEYDSDVPTDKPSDVDSASTSDHNSGSCSADDSDPPTDNSSDGDSADSLVTALV